MKRMPVLSPIAKPYPSSLIDSSATALHMAHCPKVVPTETIVAMIERANNAKYLPIFLSMVQRYKMVNQISRYRELDFGCELFSNSKNGWWNFKIKPSLSIRYPIRNNEKRDH